MAFTKSFHYQEFLYQGWVQFDMSLEISIDKTVMNEKEQEEEVAAVMVAVMVVVVVVV
jgi:hypothetical protein